MSKKQRNKSILINNLNKNAFPSAKIIKIRVSLKKINPLIKLIRGKSVNTAKNIISAQYKRSKEILIKLIDSASFNALRKGFNIKDLYINNIFANSGGIKYKLLTRSQGRANRIRRRFSNVYISLGVL